MKTLKLTILSAFVAISSILNAQLTTTNTLTAQQLVQQVLLGQGVTASNITFSGNANQIARFSATAGTNLGLLSGVLLSSGDARTSVANGPQGPNNATGLANDTEYGGPGDTDLDNIVSPDNTNDAAVIEFDFIPTGDSIKFRYIFASEEYPEYVNSINDVFAFLLSGPNPLGGNYINKNIALIPGTNSAVSINNVNATVNSTYYRNNASGTINVEFDGLTTILTALEKVVCGQTYHIKIALADVSDDQVDSGVFLEAGSFSSLPPLNVYTTNSNSNIPDSILVEDCNTYCAYFIRNGNIAQKDSFNLQVTGNAILGTDYIQSGNPSFVWPTKLIFAPNQDTIKICNIIAFNDNLNEGADTIKFEMSSFATSSVSCLSTNAIKFNLYIQDYDSIAIAQNDVTLCSGTSTILNAGASLGYPQYTYTIMPNAVNTPTLNTGPITGTNIYTITVNDVCNKPVTKTITVNAVPVPTITSSSATICASQTTTITASGATTYTWSGGISNDSLIISPTTTTNYTVIGANGTCTNSAVSTVSVMGQNVNITGNNSICFGNSTTLTANGGGSYTWNNGSTNNTITVTPTVNTTYSVTSVLLTCTNTVTYSVTVNPTPTINVNSSVICSGQTGTMSASGAVAYLWNNGGVGSLISVTPSVNTTYTVTGTSVAGCTNTAVHTVTVITSKPEITQLNDYKFCLDSVRAIPVTVTNGSAPYSITWTIPSGGITPFDTLNTTYYFTQQSTPSAGTYTIIATDLCNKKDTIVVNLQTYDCKLVVPNVVTSNGDGTNDVFKINGLENFNNTVVYVYNRWGKKVYESDNYRNDWKPDVNVGTYFYVINISDGRTFNGFFQVFK